MTDHKTIIEHIVTHIQEHYIITENIEHICSFLWKHYESGRYEHLNGEELASTLTRQLREVSNDRHFRALFSETPLPIREHINEESEDIFEMGHFLALKPLEEKTSVDHILSDCK
jgi:hypothetical protein